MTHMIVEKSEICRAGCRLETQGRDTAGRQGAGRQNSLFFRALAFDSMDVRQDKKKLGENPDSGTRK